MSAYLFSQNVATCLVSGRQWEGGSQSREYETDVYSEQDSQHVRLVPMDGAHHGQK